MYFERLTFCASIDTMTEASPLKPMVVHYGRWRIRFLFAGVALAFMFSLWLKGEPGIGRWVGIVLLEVMGVLCLLPSETCVDLAKRVLERRWKFLGLLTVYRRRLPLAQFQQICWQSVGSWDESSPNNSCAWKVGLESFSGRRLFVSYFNAPAGRVCEEAKQFAIELSRLTGLPLSHDIR
jgi:hypothetical protein